MARSYLNSWAAIFACRLPGSYETLLEAPVAHLVPSVLPVVISELHQDVCPFLLRLLDQQFQLLHVLRPRLRHCSAMVSVPPLPPQYLHQQR